MIEELIDFEVTYEELKNATIGLVIEINIVDSNYVEGSRAEAI